MFLAFFIKGMALGTFFDSMMAYLAVALSKQAQKTINYYEIFRMNVWGDAHSMRNKGRLSQERMGCFVWALDSGKWVAESLGQADEFGTNHFQLYENRVDVRKLEQNFDKKVFENWIARKLRFGGIKINKKIVELKKE